MCVDDPVLRSASLDPSFPESDVPPDFLDTAEAESNGASFEVDMVNFCSSGACLTWISSWRSENGCKVLEKQIGRLDDGFQLAG